METNIGLSFWISKPTENFCLLEEGKSKSLWKEIGVLLGVKGVNSVRKHIKEELNNTGSIEALFRGILGHVLWT